MVDDGEGGLVLVPHVLLLEFDEVLLVDGFGELVDADFGPCLLRVECGPEGGLIFVEAEEVRRRCGVFDVNVDVGREFEAGVGLYYSPRGGVEVRALESEGEASEISRGPHCWFPRLNPDACRGDGKLLHQRFHFFEGWGAVHTVEGALGHARLDAFADRRETGETHTGWTWSVN